jgi:predicted kinase
VLFRSATYREMLDRATAALELGESVILDASWSSEQHRRIAGRVAQATSSDLVELCCLAPLAVTEQRLMRRLATGADPSDATPAVARAMAGRFDPWPTATAVDTSGAVEQSVGQALTVTSGRGT